MVRKKKSQLSKKPLGHELRMGYSGGSGGQVFFFYSSLFPVLFVVVNY